MVSLLEQRCHGGNCRQNRSHSHGSRACRSVSAALHPQELQPSSSCLDRRSGFRNIRRHCCQDDIKSKRCICEYIAPLASPCTSAFLAWALRIPHRLRLHAVPQLPPASSFGMASLQQEVLELSKRLDELAAKVAPSDDDVQKHRGPIEVLIANQQEIQANQKSLQANQKALQDAVLSSHRLFQDALAAQSQQRSRSCSIC